MGEGRRTRSVGTKLTEEEYAKLEALAAQRGVTPGECVRDLVLGAFGESQPEATPTEQALLSEVLALRTILINTVYDLASGEGMTPERMEKLIAKADAGKLDKALERLKDTTATIPFYGAQVVRTYIYDTNTLDSTGFSQNIAGRLAAVQYPAQSGVQMNDMYSHTQAGLPAAKRVQVNQTATVNLDSTYTYNTEGKITGMTYPNGGPSYNYSYNSMYQLSGMTDSSNNTIVSSVSYNAANQLLGMKFNTETETRGYNSLNQLITLSASVPGNALENITYAYPAGANNGKIASMFDTVSGESVVYTYDSLNRLSTAGGNGWGQSYVYDPFGNLLQKNITAGSPPSLMQAVNTANNQIVGQSYDANGNTSGVTNGGSTYNLNYDAENRLSTVYFNPEGLYLEYYGYDAQNRRIWSWPGTLNGSNTTNYTVNVYSPAGQKLGAYLFMTYGSSMNVTLSSSDQYFGSRRLATLDQLGSAGQWGTYKGIYFPWGEAKGTPNPQDTWNFATYWQDSVTGLDYANNRYYSNAYGRFMTPDPYMGNSGGPGDPNNPQSWNRYAYVEGDPVNNVDPAGEFTLSPCVTWGDISWLCSPFSGLWQTFTMSTNPAAAAQSATQYAQWAQAQAAAQSAEALATFVNNATAKTCDHLPDGIVMSVSGSAFAGLGVTGSVEVVFNVNTGQISGFGSLGPITGGAGVQGGLSAQTGFIWGLGQSNSNYSGPFTSMNIGAGVITASLAMSSNGLQNPFALTPPTVVSGGVQTPGASATYGTTYYSNAVNVGNLNSVLTQAVVGALGPLGAAIESYYGIYQGLCGK